MHGLNSHQQRAVETVQGRVLILAGAGSGKTRVLTHRIAHLINHLKVSPKSILGLTFTNKAAAEMRHRVGSLVASADAKLVTLSTFHSFCLHILRQDIGRLGYTDRFSLYDEHDVKRLINYIARDMLGINAEMPSMAGALALINQAKNRGDSHEGICDPTSEWHQEFARTLYRRLEEAMRAHNAVDFDHLLILTVELFEKHPDVLERYQERYRYIMIDEYQDTNPIQYRLAELLSAKYDNLCVVGDDDQSIYGWRGADMRNILEFGRATTIKLEQNYRSTSTILNAANAVIGNNTKRHQKVLWSDCGAGDPIEIFVAPTDIQEAEAVVSRIAKWRESRGLAWRDMAILYRSNALSRQFELALMKHTWHDGSSWVVGIPYRVFGGTEFYERKEVKDLFAYLRVIVNPLDQEALLRIVNQPRRGIGETSLGSLTEYNRSCGLPLWHVIKGVCRGDATLDELQQSFNAKALKGLLDFVDAIETAKKRFATGSLHEALLWLVDRIDYPRAIREEVKSAQMRDFKQENVQEFVNALAQFEQSQALESNVPATLSDFITALPLDKEAGFKKLQGKESDNSVSLMTFHSAKGLEFSACFLVGVEEGIIPHAKSMLETGLEEERRLMYVAMTRAMKHLTISMAVKRMRMGKEEFCRPSPFLSELPPASYKASHHVHL